MKVNMTPNPLDVVTIHASQGDTEARQWEFELHNNGEVIDADGITEQMVFKSYNGGTEELLPSSLMNGSVDLGSLEWTAVATATSGVYRMRSSGISADVMKPSANNVKANVYNSRYSTITASESYQAIEGIAVEPNGNLFIYDSNYNTSSSATAFKDSLQGVYLWYEKSDSTPTTSPFLGDIRYPQGLLTNQEFTYRQSPTEEDGLTKITDIKGNTLVWNQLVQNGNFADTSWWSFTAGTLTVSNNIGIFKATAQWQSVSKGWFSNAIPQGHKLLCVATLKSYTANNTYFIVRDTENGVTSNVDQITLSTTKQTYSIIHTRSSGTSGMQVLFQDNNSSGWGNIEISNVMLFDLTQMDLDISNPSDFTSLFPLSYYSYNQGTLLSFNGNGIKTVGKNLWDNSQLIRGLFNDADFNHSSSQVNTSIKWYGFADTTYTVSWGIPVKLTRRIIDGAYSIVSNENVQTFTLTPTKDGYIGLSFRDNTSSTTVWNTDTTIQIEVGSTATDYEPYTSSTISLPISTYFPTGMKRAGNVYDELTESKAITRIGRVDLGSLNWSYVTSGSVLAPYLFASFSGIKSLGAPSTNKANILCSKYQTVKRDASNFVDKTICADGSLTEITQIQIKDSSYTDATAFKNSLQGQYLYYEMVAETETSFTTASLVTENAEIPLSNEDGTLIGKCTEELSSQPGFIDAKIKLTDGDGTCYSNKIQLHVERKP